jgi:hypothetical protein
MDDDNEAPFPSVPGFSNYPLYNTDSDSNTTSVGGSVIDLERSFSPNEDPVVRAKRLLRQNVDGAASVLIEIALHGSSEKLRMDAAKVILDRVLGPVANVQAETNDSPLEQLFAQLDAVAHGSSE